MKNKKKAARHPGAPLSFLTPKTRAIVNTPLRLTPAPLSLCLKYLPPEASAANEVR